MTVYGVGLGDIKRVIGGVNRDYGTSLEMRGPVQWEDKRGHKRVRFVLRLIDSADAFHRRSPVKGRRMINVCWHGTAVVLDRLFKLYPEAKVSTAAVRFSDREDWREKYKRFGVRYMFCDCLDVKVRVERELQD